MRNGHSGTSLAASSPGAAVGRVPPVRRPVRYLLFVLVLGGGLLLGLDAAASASPADPRAQTLTQPDGSTVTARLYGDEYVNGFETLAGYTIVPDTSGTWSFAEATPGGRLRPSGLLPDADGRPPAGAELAPHLRDQVALATAETERAETAEAGPGTPPAVGTQPVLVVLAQFQNRSLTTTAADWNELFFGADQSMADYYDAASFGQLDLQPATETEGTADDGVVVVTLPRNHPNSGRNFFGYNAVARQILAAADATVDFAAYDAVINGGNGDGSLSPDELHLGIVVAGTEAAQACTGPSIWAHRSPLNTPLTADGVVLGDGEANGGFFTGGELQCDGPEAQATLGIWVHEFGHDLGWIDLYDVDGSSVGVDTWSVMGLHWLALPGERTGTRPPLPDPFSRWQVGWLTPTQVTTTTADVPLTSSATTDDVLQVRDNPDGVDVGFLGGGGTGEYFLLEDREQAGYDIALAGCGTMVWHIDERRSDNADDHARRVDVEEAGDANRQYGFADEQDPFPSELPANGRFGPDTRPSSALNSGLPSGVDLSGFSTSCGPAVTVDVDPGGPASGPPVNDRVADAPLIRVSPYLSQGHRTVSGHNVDATRQPGEPRHGVAAGHSSIWWAFQAPRNGFVNITSESTFREAIAVYTGTTITTLRRVESVRGLPPGAGAGSPAAPETVYQGLAFPVERNVRYLIAVDSLVAGDEGGIRLVVDYDQAYPEARAVARPAPGRRPLVRVRIRNTSESDRLRVYNLLDGNVAVDAVDCPDVFVLQPHQARTCHVRPPLTGPAGASLRSKVTAWIQWLGAQRYSSVSDPWFTRVRA